MLLNRGTVPKAVSWNDIKTTTLNTLSRANEIAITGIPRYILGSGVMVHDILRITVLKISIDFSNSSSLSDPKPNRNAL